MIIATGVTYRRLGIPALDRLIGAGVFYGAAGVEAQPWPASRSTSSAAPTPPGQAALHLAKFAARVTLLVRGPSLDAGMSDYLVRQIEATPNIDVRLAHPGRRRPRRGPPGGPDLEDVHGRAGARCPRRRCSS